MQHVFISGVHRGLGRALAELWLERGAHVFGISRQRPDGLEHEHFDFARVDLGALETVGSSMHRLLNAEGRLDAVFLNAGTLGEVKRLDESSLHELRRVMDINLWANKILLDQLLIPERTVARVVAISSGAAKLASDGWGGYAMSKAALNVLTAVAAQEHPGTHFLAVAPGLVDTPMLQGILDDPDSAQFTAGQRLRVARDADRVWTARDAAQRLIDLVTRPDLPSGSYVDLRDLDADGTPPPESPETTAPGGPDLAELVARVSRPGPGRGRAIAELRRALLEKKR